MSDKHRWTELEYQAYLARTSPAIARTHVEAGVTHEWELHEQIRQEVARRGWVGLHGSMAHRTHRTRGEFDWTIIADKGRVFFIECKRPGAKASQYQLQLMAQARKLGHTPHIVESLLQFMEIVA